MEAALPDKKEELTVILAVKERCASGSHFGPIIRDVYIIECCTCGSGSVIINNKEFPVKAGDCYVLLPGDAVTHTAHKTDPRRGFSCVLNGASVGSYLKEAGISSETPFADPSVFEEARNWMEQLVLQCPCRDTGARLRQLGCAYGLLGAILRDNRTIEKCGTIDRAIGFMETNYPYPLTVTDIAQAVGLEQSYLSVLFKEKTRFSPYRYLTQLRIQKACQLLLSHDCSISEVSYLVGLEPHNFSRIFKREIGITPTEYLKRINRKKQHEPAD